MRRVPSVIVTTALLLSACGGETRDGTAAATSVLPTISATSVETTTAPAPTDAESVTTTTVVVPSVEVVKNLVYRSSDTSPNRVDVYHPTATEHGPVVVLFHGGGVDKSFPLYPRLASAIAEQGAVVFVANWDTSVTGEPDAFFAKMDGVGCAISYALAHAVEYGADPETLVLFGHSAGASAAATGGLRKAVPVADCSVSMAPFIADGLVLWEGDWMLTDSFTWDQYGDGLPALMEPITPWTWIDTAPTMSVVLVTTLGGRRDLRSCGISDPTSPYWVRDPDGWFRERLDTIKALEDDCIDVGEPTEVLADTMREHGYDLTELFLEHSGHVNLNPDDQTRLVDEVIAITARP